MKTDHSLVRDIAIAGTVLLCIVVVGIVRAARRSAPDRGMSVATAAPTNLDGESQQSIDVVGRPERKSNRQVVLDKIAKHKEKIAENPKRDEVPAYQLAIANLYITKLGDYETASIHLEELISQSPENNLAPQAYAKLAKCYESMGWRDMADATYRRMMRHFPEDSPNHQYARAKRRGAENIY